VLTWGVLLVLATLATAAWVAARRDRAGREAAALRSVRGTAEEDVARLAEDVALLGSLPPGSDLDEGTRRDHARALGAYEAATRALAGMRRPEDVHAVTEALEEGLYTVACVHARAGGRPLPVRRPPCFFDPRHGPSCADADWAPSNGTQGRVPVCAADAERLRTGAAPDIRTVLADGRHRPYWRAGPAYGPYAGGYFGAYADSGLLPGVLLAAVLTGTLADARDDGA